jgi:hypothetical protein
MSISLNRHPRGFTLNFAELLVTAPVRSRLHRLGEWCGLSLSQIRLEDERITWTVERICQVIWDWQSREPLPTCDMVMALPLAIAQYIAVTTPGGDRRRQLAAAEAVLRQLGRSCLSASYDRTRLSDFLSRSTLLSGPR